MTDEQKKEERKTDEPAAAPPTQGKPPAAVPSKPATATPRPPAQPKPPQPEPLDNELVRRLRARFGEAIGESTIDREQAIVVVAQDRLLAVCTYLKKEEKFDFLTDLTAVDWFEREKRFDVILNLYSFSHNQRLRLKVQVSETCPSVTAVWATANWLERECFDMFGVIFEGHPDLKRILLPDEWKGYPLRKDYDILRQDEEWVQENLGIESGQ
ncbi:MAG: NADH-quinone oxidoreductase subunit C [Terriglobia bacterium]